MGLSAQLLAANSARRSFGSRCFHFVRIALVVAALFPFISASDDVLRMERYNSQANTKSHVPHEQGTQRALITLYEAMDSPMAVGSFEVSITLLAAWTLELLFSELRTRCSPSQAGRSPPFSAVAA